MRVPFSHLLLRSDTLAVVVRMCRVSMIMIVVVVFMAMIVIVSMTVSVPVSMTMSVSMAVVVVMAQCHCKTITEDGRRADHGEYYGSKAACAHRLKKTPPHGCTHIHQQHTHITHT